MWLESGAGSQPQLVKQPELAENWDWMPVLDAAEARTFFGK
jgi:hypothetical protein